MLYEEPFMKEKKQDISITFFKNTLLVFTILAFLSRIFLLGDKGIHHDESIHALFSYNLANGNPYKYDPVYHGPVLYYITGAFTWFISFLGFSINEFLIRLPAAFFGALTVFTPLIGFGIFTRRWILIFMTLLLCSPTLMYFGRFLREDAFMMFWILSFIFLLLRNFIEVQKIEENYEDNPKLAEKKYSYTTIYSALAALLLALQFANKENTYLHAYLWNMWAIGALLWTKKYSFFHKISSINALDKYLLTVSVFLITYTLFFTSFFYDIHNISDLFKKLHYAAIGALNYWHGQHQIQRIGGEFDYHIPILANYEFLLIILTFIFWFSQSYSFIKTNKNIQQKIIIIFSSLSLIFFTLYIIIPSLQLSLDIQNLFKNLHINITSYHHIILVFFFIFFGGTGFLISFFQKKVFLNFIWFWFTGTCGAYSYAGEKVPWLAVYYLLPMLFLASWGAENLFLTLQKFKPKAKFMIYLSSSFLLFFTIQKSINASFFDSDHPSERLVFTQTTHQIHQIAIFLREEAQKDPTLLITYTNDVAWPLTWYFRPLDHIFRKDKKYTNAFYTPVEKLKEKTPEEGTISYVQNNFNRSKVIFLSLDEDHIFQNQPQIKEIFQNYHRYTLPMRAWWVPQNSPTFQEVLQYFFKKELFFPTIGDMPMVLYTQKQINPQILQKISQILEKPLY